MALMGIPQMTNYFLPSRFSQTQPAARNQWGGPIDVAKLMPGCHNLDLMMLQVERFMRADAALSAWAEDAKRCVEFLENKQWSAKEIAEAEAEDRPLISLNKIAPLVRLVLGYHRNNRVDLKYLPTSDANSSEAVADVLTKLVKQVSVNSQEPYVDTEVFFDGIVTGRGYYDARLDHEKNDFGEIKIGAKDPFTIRPDADADQYDSRTWGHVFEARWANLDEIEFHFGRNVAALIQPLVASSGYRGGVPSDILESVEEITPWRSFGGQQGGPWGSSAWSVESYIANSVDPYRKNIRIIDGQHYVRVMQRNIVDLETGDRQPIPTHFTVDQVQKIMSWCAEQYWMKGKECPLRVEWRPTRRPRWTTMIGDIIVYDQWSPYENLTIVPFFPYWRRGQTRGMINDLIDPQREVNKRRSSQVDILTRVAHSGWMWHENSMREEEKEKIESHGGAPGINIEWRGSSEMKPERLEPGSMPTGIEKLEEKATLDLKEIAGINDSALGQVDRVQSGRAIEARQKQSVLGIETYMDNMRRTKQLLGWKKLELIQNHYTEPRMYRILGEAGTWSWIGINQRQATGEILNNVNAGRYDVVVDESPLSATWMNAQFEEILALVEKGVLPIPMVQDIIVNLSSIPQKELVKQRMSAYLKAMGMLTADEMMVAQAVAEQTGVPINQALIPPPDMFGQPKGSSSVGGKKDGEGGSVAGGGAGGAPGGASQAKQNSASQGSGPPA
jgi:hypothetical protein